jgi:hypothetical protein
MLEIILYQDIGAFFGGAVGSISSFWVGMMFLAIFVFLLIKIQAPTSLVAMVAVILLAIIGGYNNKWIGVTLAPISTFFAPVMVLVIILVGGIFAYALWRMFGS